MTCFFILTKTFIYSETFLLRVSVSLFSCLSSKKIVQAQLPWSATVFVWYDQVQWVCVAFSFFSLKFFRNRIVMISYVNVCFTLPGKGAWPYRTWLPWAINSSGITQRTRLKCNVVWVLFFFFFNRHNAEGCSCVFSGKELIKRFAFVSVFSHRPPRQHHPRKRMYRLSTMSFGKAFKLIVSVILWSE